MKELLDNFRAIRGVDMAAVVGTDGLVIESLTQASHEDFETNAIVKSLARVGGPFFKITANHMPVFAEDAEKMPRLMHTIADNDRS